MKIELRTREYGTILGALNDAISWVKLQLEMAQKNEYLATCDMLQKQIDKYENLYNRLSTLKDE